MERIGRNDFVEARQQRAIDSPSRGDFYWVCEEYEVEKKAQGAEGSLASYLIRPRYDLREDDKWRLYKPLEDTPDLFLKFSRLHERERCVETALSWAHAYGLLNTERHGVLEPEQETLQVFFREVDRAAAVLSMYEAVLNEDSEAAEWAARVKFSAVTKWHWVDYFMVSGMARSDSDYLGFALATAAFEVSGMVERFSRRTLSVIVDGEPSPADVKAGWSFYSLLGAMYLQSYWLMASGGEIARCEQCGRVISLARPHPEGRKRRRDKRFCDDACRQAKHRSKKKI